ncbi:hypothetical protein [Streptomyces flaveolus]|uniref:hypothetical protein n=1 Tax=Streptomyces flaveolus TaxID=67297 RepID=UPI003702662E
MVTQAGLYGARGYALAGDAADCRRQLTLARRKFACLDRRDLLEAPWPTGTEGEMRSVFGIEAEQQLGSLSTSCGLYMLRMTSAASTVLPRCSPPDVRALRRTFSHGLSDRDWARSRTTRATSTPGGG